jgi:hypothetical protein
MEYMSSSDSVVKQEMATSKNRRAEIPTEKASAIPLRSGAIYWHLLIIALQSSER